MKGASVARKMAPIDLLNAGLPKPSICKKHNIYEVQ